MSREAGASASRRPAGRLTLPNVADYFRRLAQRVEPHGVFSSLLARRLGIVE